MACSANKYAQTCVFFRKFHTCLKLGGRESLTEKVAAVKQSREVVIPRRKKRDELSILRALASTVQRDTTAPSYSFIDDPYLMPLSKMEQRLFAFSKASGQKAAQYVLHEYPHTFAYDPAEPQIKALMPPAGPHTAEDTLEGLAERIDTRQPLAAYASYQKIVESGETVPMETTEQLLDLLCYFNSADPPEKQYVEEVHFQMMSADKRKPSDNWNSAGAAAMLFSSLDNPSVHACCSMIRAYAKFNAPEAAYILYKQLREKDAQLDVKTYNALISSAAVQRTSCEEKWQRILDLLKDMAACGVSPDIDTFNSILLVLTKHRRLTLVQTWSMHVLNEIRQCGLEPSLTTWNHLITIHYAQPESQSPLLAQIINHLSGRHLTLRHPVDYQFFSNAMKKCYENLKDLDLAYKLDALLDVGSNRSLLGASFRIGPYYSAFMQLLCMFAEVDTVMSYYDKLTPHMFTPTHSVISELLLALDLNEGFQYLPRVWSDMKFFGYERLGSLTEQLLVIMAKKRQEKQLQDMFVKVVDDIRLEAEQNGHNRAQIYSLSGKALGYMAQIYLHNDNFDDAWDVIETYVANRNMIDGFPSESALVHVAEACIELRDVTKTLKVLSLMADFAYPKFEEFLSKARSTLELTDDQRRELEDM